MEMNNTQSHKAQQALRSATEKKQKHLHELKYLRLHLELNCVHADVDMLVSLAAVLQMVKSFDLIQGVQQTPGEQIDPQHTGWVYTELQAVQLGVQVRGGHWKKEKNEEVHLSGMCNYVTIYGSYTIRVFQFTSKEAMLLTVKNMIPDTLGLSGK